ncbi:hypothetical protein F5984_20545 [Rudanella paleaurantiibacter]|uniref:Uncharacterized protein n=1 Tax=Rudanella paleaurantiibacter TaxID=2614655 RepID=A0A7J5TVM5_9BACT|nr:hypothetical protein [Rudanella paleaurantiibacter]KAB7728137.1 hypothetical protein F5984_20545 [Rudanella paleaurantiibacter]
MNPIQHWLDTDGDYMEGLALLGSQVSPFLFACLSKGENTYNRNRLREELQKQIPVSDPAVLPTTPADREVHRPAAVLQLEQEAQKLMNERVELKARLRARMDSPDADGRQADALRILAIGKELDSLFGKIGFWREHGYLPIDQSPDEAQEQVLTLMNVRTYVSRYRSLLKKLPADSPRRVEAQRLLAHYETEKQRIENENRTRTI